MEWSSKGCLRQGSLFVVAEVTTAEWQHYARQQLCWPECQIHQYIKKRHFVATVQKRPLQLNMIMMHPHINQEPCQTTFKDTSKMQTCLLLHHWRCDHLLQLVAVPFAAAERQPAMQRPYISSLQTTANAVEHHCDT